MACTSGGMHNPAMPHVRQPTHDEMVARIDGVALPTVCPDCGRPVHDHGRPTITTNNVPRDILDAYELAPAERADFDYLDWSAIERGEDSASFFRYRGQLYDLGEFERWDNPASPTRLGWDGFRSDSYFSGIVVRYVNDCERIVVGTVIS